MSKQLTCWLVLLYTTVLFSQEDSISRKVILDSSSFNAVVSVITSQGVMINGDTLLDEISSASSAQMWGYKMNTWEWTQRQSSTLGGLVYNSLDPVLESKADGTYNFLTLDQTIPLSHSSNVPLSNLYYRSGFGGGQLFGIQSLSPVDSSQQLYLDYSRMNSLGVYRNEGADGHELNLSLVSNTRLEERTGLQSLISSVRQDKMVDWLSQITLRQIFLHFVLISVLMIPLGNILRKISWLSSLEIGRIKLQRRLI